MSNPIKLHIEIDHVGTVASDVLVSVERKTTDYISTLAYRFERQGHRKAARAFAAALQGLHLEAINSVAPFLLAFEKVVIDSGAILKNGRELFFITSVIEAAKAETTETP